MARQRSIRVAESHLIADDVREGLCGRPKRLPAYLLYDEAGAALFERITALPEYYLTRAERWILANRSAEIVEAAAGAWPAPFDVVEFGAGTADKTRLLLRAVVRWQGGTRYVPIDVSEPSLREASKRVSAAEARVEVMPIAGHHEQAFAAVEALGHRQLVLFLGSSIGNYDHDEAVAMLGGIRAVMKPGGRLLLGTDRRKSPEVMIPAYDDSAGVTAAFNKNLLARINRELAGCFALERFEHVAWWNAEASRMEMHLQSVVDQIVPMRDLGAEVLFRRGERIHTESSYKYDLAMVDRMLEQAGFRREATFDDEGGLVWVHLARPVA